MKYARQKKDENFTSPLYETENRIKLPGVERTRKWGVIAEWVGVVFVWNERVLKTDDDYTIL